MEADELSSKILPPRRSALSATISLAEQLDTDSDSADDSDSHVRSRKKKKGKKKGPSGAQSKPKDKANSIQSISAGPKLSKSASSKLKSALSFSDAFETSSRTADSIATKPRPRPRPTVMKKVSTPAPRQPSLEDDISDLTSIGSSRDSRSLSRETSVAIIDPIIPSKSHPMPGLSSNGDKPSQRNSSSWSLDALGSYVWVLLDPANQLVFNPGNNHEDDHTGEQLWWPAKIKSLRITDVPIQVKLFGSGLNVVDIHSPCESNILSRLNSLGQTRFQVPTFHPDSTNSPNDLELLASPRKKLKHGSKWEKKWNTAVSEMIFEIEGDHDSDDLPNAAIAFDLDLMRKHKKESSTSNVGGLSSIQGPSRNSGKAKRRRKEESLSAEDEFDLLPTRVAQEELWVPPPLDDELNVPGELVLARDHRASYSPYWPAKLLAYLPPTSKKDQAKFTVIWLDGTVKDIPRSWFYTMQQEEFATCKLGNFVSEVVEVHNDHDDDQLDAMDSRRVSLSPIPKIPGPPRELFTQLPIREQFVYTKGVLYAILKNEYLPTQERHRMFIQGGKYRKAVVGDSTLRGSMDARDIEKLQLYVREWCLRDGGRTTAGDKKDAQPSPFASEAPDFSTATSRQPNLTRSESEHKFDFDTSAQIDTTSIQDAPQPQPQGPLVENLDTRMRDPGSPAVTEPVMLSSPVQPPPSSLPLGLEKNESFISDTPSTSAMVSDHIAVDDCSLPPPPSEQVDDLSDALSDLTDCPQDNHASVSPVRLCGSPDYEALSPITKVDYCMNIILPEAIRQILLWRTGHRTSFALLSPREEQELYDKGQQLLEERDWVGDIKRVRKLMEQGLERKKAKNATVHMGSTSTSSRRRRT